MSGFSEEMESNFKAYEQLESAGDTASLRGWYVGFVQGHAVAADKLLWRLEDEIRREHPKQPYYCTIVPRERPAVEEPELEGHRKGFKRTVPSSLEDYSHR